MGPGVSPEIEVNWMGTILPSGVPRDKWRQGFWEGMWIEGQKSQPDWFVFRMEEGDETKAENIDPLFKEASFTGAHRNRRGFYIEPHPVGG